MTFNDEQLAIFAHAESAPNSMIVEALPGTGKSTIAVHLLPKLKGTVFLCAYGKEAVKHLTAKAKPVVGDELEGRGARIKIQTTHGLGWGVCMRNWGYKLNLDNSKVRIITKSIAKSEPLAAKYSRFITRLVGFGKRAGLGVLGTIDNPKNWNGIIKQYDLESELMYGSEDLPQIIEVAKLVYHESLRQCQHTCDHDDQILAPLYHGLRFAKYDNVIIDEAQDTSELRLHMLLSLPKRAGRIIAVGDSNQAIMGFAGSKTDSMREIQEMTDADSYPLSISYRLPKSAIKRASAFAPNIKAAPDAIQGTEMEVWMEATVPSEEYIKKPLARPFRPAQWGESHRLGFWANCYPLTKDDAILCRNTKPLVELAYQLIRRSIPCKVEGKAIGEGLIRLAEKWGSHLTLEAMEMRLLDHKRSEVNRLVGLMKDDEAEKVTETCDTVQVLVEALLERGKTMVTDLRDIVDAIFGDTEEGIAPDMCTLSTIHKAKGREWQRVFVLGYHEYMPNRHAKLPQQLREERNLQFIAVTRHMRSLVIVHMPEFKKKGAPNGSKETDGSSSTTRDGGGGGSGMDLDVPGVREEEHDNEPVYQGLCKVQTKPRRSARPGWSVGNGGGRLTH